MINNKSKTWESGIEVLESMLIVIPQKLLSVCDYIAGKISGDDEFSIFCNIKETVGDIVYLSDEFYIPKQEVTRTSIDYLDDPEAHKYNVVIHRHPDGMNVFSGTDREYINQNFTLSLLYTKVGKFVHGVYNFKMEHFLIPIGVETLIDNGIDELDLSAIAKKTYTNYTVDRYKDQYKKTDANGVTSWEYGSFGEGFDENWDYERGDWKKNKEISDWNKEQILKAENAAKTNTKANGQFTTDDESKQTTTSTFVIEAFTDKISDLSEELESIREEYEGYRYAVEQTCDALTLQAIEEEIDRFMNGVQSDAPIVNEDKKLLNEFKEEINNAFNK